MLKKGTAQSAFSRGLTRNPLLSRRRFLQGTAAAGLAAPFYAASGLRAASPNGKLNHACIGVGGRGFGDFLEFQQHEGVEIVAICDVDANQLEKVASAVPGARRYSDWRELLAAEGDKIDSVTVSVPDHMHFPIAFSAIQMGKHIYCQKPMCHDVAEVRALTEAAVQENIISQLGTQAASGFGNRTAVRWLRSGVIGKVNHAYLCSNRPGAVERYRLAGPRPARGEKAPAHLNWDLWLGSAPERPFAPEIYHPKLWRAWLDFGTGWSGDIGCHIFDAVWKGLRMEPALSVVSEVQESWKESPERRADTWPQGDHITWTFPGNELTESAEWALEWFDGEFYPPEEIRNLYPGTDYPAESAMIVGTEGKMLIPHKRIPILLPEEKFRDVAKPELEPRNHYHHFVDTCLGEAECESHFAQTGPMTEAIILGTVANRVPGEKLTWDSAQLEITNNAEANRLLRRQYRDGWSAGPF